MINWRFPFYWPSEWKQIPSAAKNNKRDKRLLTGDRFDFGCKLPSVIKASQKTKNASVVVYGSLLLSSQPLGDYLVWRSRSSVILLIWRNERVSWICQAIFLRHCLLSSCDAKTMLASLATVASSSLLPKAWFYLRATLRIHAVLPK